MNKVAVKKAWAGKPDRKLEHDVGDDKNRSILRKLPLCVGLAGGVGGILPDFDHAYRLILNPEYSVCYLHHYGWVAVVIFGIGGLIAFGGRQTATLVLRVFGGLPYLAKSLVRLGASIFIGG